MKCHCTVEKSARRVMYYQVNNKKTCQLSNNGNVYSKFTYANQTAVLLLTYAGNISQYISCAFLFTSYIF